MWRKSGTYAVMPSWFMCCELFKALVLLASRFVYAHAGLLTVIVCGVILLFKHCRVFRRTVWFFYTLAVYLGSLAAWCTILTPLLYFRPRDFDNVR